MPTESFSRLLIRLSRPVMQALGYSSHIIETAEGQAHYYQIKGRGKLPPIVVLPPQEQLASICQETSS